MSTMTRSQRRLLILLLALPMVLVAAAFLYMLGMSQLEGETRGFWQGLSWAAETLSTTGYGADSAWRHPLMILFVVLMQFAGVLMVFLIFPVYLIPFLEERFEGKLPKEIAKLEGHVVVYRYGPPVATLLEELGKAGVAAALVETDAAEARRRVEHGDKVVFGQLEDDVLSRVHLAEARALIVNGADDENAYVILSARQSGFGGDVLAMVEEPTHRKPMMLAGATASFTPRHILGAALAARASQRISPTLAGIQQLGRKLRVHEIKIQADSDLAGKTLAETGVGRRTGVTVLGQWVGGRLRGQPTPEMRFLPDSVVIVAGSSENIRRFGDLCGEAGLRPHHGPFVVAGYGEVGSKVVELLREVDEEVQIIDSQPLPGVDVLGNMLDASILESTAVRDAQAVVLALDADSATLFATVILKDFAPRVPVIARVNQAENVERIHQAGADFALSISQVSGQMLARRLLGQEAIAIDPQLRLLKVSARGLEGHHPSELGIRERTGCSVVAVERGEDLLVDFGPEFEFAEMDAVYVCGSGEATGRFVEVFPQA